LIEFPPRFTEPEDAMKILFLGGAGDMAVPALNELARERAKDPARVTAITIVDLNEAKAQASVAKAGLTEITKIVSHDIMDRDWIVAQAREHDVALGFAGPFYVMEKHLGSCCVEAGTPYVSIADDYDAYLSVIELEVEAQRRNVKLLTGWGNSPGITQMLARAGYNAIHRPRKINVNWTAGSNEAVGATNLMHLFHIFHGTTLQTFDGKEVAVPCGGGRKIVEFPAPIGKVPVYYTGHAESVSIPRNLSGLVEVTLHGGVKPPYIPKLVMALEKTGMFNTHSRRKRWAKIFHRIESLFSFGGPDKSVGRIEVSGEDLQGLEVKKCYTYVGHIAELTAFPAVQAALWLKAGKFDKLPGGVYSGERLLTVPEPFLEELVARGLDIREQPC